MQEVVDLAQDLLGLPAGDEMFTDAFTLPFARAAQHTLNQRLNFLIVSDTFSTVAGTASYTIAPPATLPPFLTDYFLRVTTTGEQRLLYPLQGGPAEIDRRFGMDWTQQGSPSHYRLTRELSLVGTAPTVTRKFNLFLVPNSVITIEYWYYPELPASALADSSVFPNSCQMLLAAMTARSIALAEGNERFPLKQSSLRQIIAEELGNRGHLDASAGLAMLTRPVSFGEMLRMSRGA